MLKEAKDSWYPLVEPTEAVAQIIPKDFLVDAKIMGVDLDTVTIEKVSREGSSLLVDVGFNNTTSTRLTVDAQIGVKSYSISHNGNIGSLVFYNADLAGILAVDTDILSSRVYDYGEALVTKVRVLGIGSITGWKGTVLNQILEYPSELKLIPGTNCSIEYNSLNNTIYITKATGMGEGTTKDTCDTPQDGSIIRINGELLTSTNLNIVGGSGVTVTQTDNGVSLFLDGEVVKGL